MAQLQAQLQAVTQGHLPTEEPLPVQWEAAPLLMGADGVMVAFRPEGGQPRGKTAWHEVSPPYTIFLLNDDMKLNRNRQFLI